MGLGIKTKLIGGFSILVLLLIAVGITGYLNLNQMKSQMSEMYNGSTLPLNELGLVDASLYQIRGDVYKFDLLPAQRDETEADLNSARNQINTQLSAYHSINLSASEKQALAAVDNTWSTYNGEVDKCMVLIKAGQEQEMLSMIADGGSTSNARKAGRCCSHKSHGDKRC